MAEICKLIQKTQLLQAFTSKDKPYLLKQKMGKLATINIAELLQNWQHVQTPYLDQIWHVTVGEWSILTPGSYGCQPRKLYRQSARR